MPLIPQEAMAEVFGKTSAYSRTLMSEAQSDGVVKPHSVAFMGGLIGGGIRNTLKWHRATHDTLTYEDKRQIAQMCWDAIATDEHRGISRTSSDSRASSLRAGPDTQIAPKAAGILN